MQLLLQLTAFLSTQTAISSDGFCITLSAKVPPRRSKIHQPPQLFAEYTQEGSKTNNSVTTTAQLLPTPPPPDPTSSNPADDGFRTLRRRLPQWLQQHWLRDSGALRWLLDTSVPLFAVKPLLEKHPHALFQFFQLSNANNAQSWQQTILKALLLPYSQHKKTRCDADAAVSSSSGRLDDISFQELSYGPHPRQVIHLMRRSPPPPPSSGTIRAPASSSCRTDDETTKHLVVFVHGGAWGSGYPALYRLAAIPFLETAVADGRNDTATSTAAAAAAVAVVGYRTYPTAAVPGQVDDVVRAVQFLLRRFPSDFSVVTLVGHSSGAHLCAMALLQQQQQQKGGDRFKIDRFVGIAGVYDIPAHYIFESGRGVERISPMAPACGGSVAAWRRHSPTYLVAAAEQRSCCWNEKDDDARFMLPPTLLCHGALDSTVPYTSSAGFVAAVANCCNINNKQCTLEILPETGHSETVLHLMFGGETRDIVMNWLSKEQTERTALEYKT